MLYFLRHDKKAFVSSMLKHKLSHTDKSNPDNIDIPLFIDTLNDRKLNQTLEKLLKKYKQKNYTLYSREELHTDNNWHDIHFILLFMFYKKGLHIKIDQNDFHFPHFLFTYNLKPLQEEIDKIISKVYDKIDSKASKEELLNSYTYSALDISYILYYLSIDESTSKK